MRHALAAAVLVAVSAACVAGAATPTVRLTGVPAEPTAQRPWTATLVVAGSTARPTLVARGAAVRTFATVSGARRALACARRAARPAGGAWRRGSPAGRIGSARSPSAAQRRTT